MLRSWLCLALVLAGCSAPPPHVGGCPDAACDEADVAVAQDVGPEAATEPEGETCPPGAEAPSERLWPVPGELFYAQLGLGGFALGEAAVLVSPGGEIVLIDVGNDSHDDDVGAFLGGVSAALEAFPGVDPDGPPGVDHVLVTHYHADHGDGLEDLVEAFDVRGRVVHRGGGDLTPAANPDTFDKVSGAAALFPGSEHLLCPGTSPEACGPLGLELAGGATLDIVAAGGVIDGDAYEDLVGPLLAQDSNGENARSAVALVRFGSFTLLAAGDLTGGGSDTDDVESFYAPRLASAAPTLADGLGVDVLHAGHHGRNTSTLPGPWLDLLLPPDGASRQVVMGISTAHLGSPHAEVLDAVLGPADDRLGDGRPWTTRVAAGGASTPRLIDAGGGSILVRTFDAGQGYVVQAIDDDGEPFWTEAFHTVRRCPP